MAYAINQPVVPAVSLARLAAQPGAQPPAQPGAQPPAGRVHSRMHSLVCAVQLAGCSADCSAGVVGHGLGKWARQCAVLHRRFGRLASAARSVGEREAQEALRALGDLRHRCFVSPTSDSSEQTTEPLLSFILSGQKIE